MHVAVITDIHANLPALEAVLASDRSAGVEEIWCLGDVVGYGAEPDACAELVRERCAVCLVGNHDLAVLGGLDISSFSEAAAEAVEWTREQSASATLEFLREPRPRPPEREGIGLFHASPRDPVWEYVLSIEQADACMDAQPRAAGADRPLARLALLHPPPEDGGPAESAAARPSDGAQLDLAEGRWLLNPGSVGQPRDGDPRAAWLELDTETQAARFHRVAVRHRPRRRGDRRGRPAEPPRRPPPDRPVTRQLQANRSSETVV